MFSSPGSRVGHGIRSRAESGIILPPFVTQIACVGFDLYIPWSRHNHVKITTRFRSEIAATEVNSYCRFNGDSGNNYTWANDGTNGGGQGGAGGSAPTSQMEIGNASGANAPAGDVHAAIMSILHYKDPLNHKTIIIDAAHRLSTANTGINRRQTMGCYIVNDPIFMISFLLNSSNTYSIGSTVHLGFFD